MDLNLNRLCSIVRSHFCKSVSQAVNIMQQSRLSAASAGILLTHLETDGISYIGVLGQYQAQYVALNLPFWMCCQCLDLMRMFTRLFSPPWRTLTPSVTLVIISGTFSWWKIRAEPVLMMLQKCWAINQLSLKLSCLWCLLLSLMLCDKPWGLGSGLEAQIAFKSSQFYLCSTFSTQWQFKVFHIRI